MAYREWARRGAPQWVTVVVIAAIVAVVIGFALG